MRRVISFKNSTLPVVFFSWIAALTVGFWDIYYAFYVFFLILLVQELYRNFAIQNNNIVIRILDLGICSILLFEIVSCFFQIYPVNTIFFVLRIGTVCLAYFIYSSLPAAAFRSALTRAIAGYGVIMGIATFFFFLLFKNNVNREGYYDLLSLKHLYEPFNQLSNDWSGILLIFFAFNFYFFLNTKNWWSGVGAIFLLFSILISFSRGAYLAVIAFIITIFVLTLTTRLFTVSQLFKVFIFIVVVFASVFLLFSDPILKTFKGVETVSQQRSIKGRISILDDARAMVKDHPVVGMGSGNFALYFPQYKDKSIDAGSTTRVGNSFLQLIIERGIIGVLVYCFLFVHASFIVFRSIRKNSIDKEKKLFLCVVMSLLLAIGIKEFTFSSFFENSSLMLLVFLILALIRDESPVLFSFALTGKARLGSVAVIVLAGVAGLKLYTLQKADRLHTQAIRSTNKHDYKNALRTLDQAIRLSPRQPVYFLHKAIVLERLYSEERNDQIFGLNYAGILPKISSSEKDQIIDQYKSALKYNPKDDRVQHNLGWYYFSKGDMANASKHLQAATELESSEAIYCISYGILLDSINKNSLLANNFFTKALLLSPGIVNSVFWKNFSIKYPERQRTIIQHAKKELEIVMPGNVVMKAKYAALIMDPFKPDSARRLLEQVNIEMPNLSRAWLNMGILYFNKENIQKAVPCIKRAALLDKNDYKPILLLASYFEKIRRYKEAAVYYKIAFEMLIDLKSHYDYKIIKTYTATATLPTVPWKLWLAVKSDYTIDKLCEKLSDINKFAQNDSLVHVYDGLRTKIFLTKNDLDSLSR